MNGPAAEWDAALAERRFLIQQPVGGGKAVFPPRAFAPGTGAGLEWVEASGNGTIYSATWIQRKPPEPPYNVVLVDLAEGARLMGRVEGVTPETLSIGMAVKARIIGGETPMIVFDPVEQAHG
ncbi:MAG: OB-fold domain-containing protein [Novosphingobium sp.]|uniref:Zn-ribbon domain-containing OB-fold protein n=1 Tax=unclassified Novosphingobium TaxID=2644732 RepID=UPI0006B9881F|nr:MULTISPECIES: OB-fold domain-containing protein [unclassified Novosphingobium]KPF80641.1 hypothetical protein IP83_14820 [Novosphingobium sp. AAP93]MBY0391659.1 OB-fold domain-containing protein [Novosphingobium sp.]